MKPMRHTLLLAGISFLVLNLGAARTATIHVKADAAPGGNGSEGNPFQTIGEAVVALGLSNSVSQGGHTISVAAGEYPEEVVFENAHSGAEGFPNWLSLADGLNVGDAVILENRLLINNCSNLVVNGMMMKGSTSAGWHEGGVQLDGADSNYITLTNCIVTGSAMHGISLRSLGSGLRRDGFSMWNCLVYDNARSGLWVGTRSYSIVVRNSVFYGNSEHGVFSSDYSDILLENSVLANNGVYGSAEGHSRGPITTRYNCFYGNGNGQCYAAGSILDIEQEINEFADYEGNIVVNPGFSDLANNWNFNHFYSDSRCLTSGEGGVVIGPYAAPPTVDPSNAIYHVCADIGDDSRLPAEAQHILTPWKTITNAAHFAAAGDTVMVHPGTYNEEVQILKGGSMNPVVYQAVGEVIMDGTDKTGTGFIVDRAIDVLIDGFTVLQYGSGYHLAHSSHVTIQNGVVCSNASYGVYMDKTVRSMLADMEIYDSRYGLSFNTQNSHGGFGSYGVVVERSSLHSQQYGFFTANNRIPAFKNSNIYNNTVDGIYTRGNSGGPIENCVIYGNDRYGVFASNSGGIPVVRNSIIANNNYGLYAGHPQCRFMSINNLYWNNNVHYRDANSELGYTDLTTAAEINSLTVAVTENNIEGDPLFRDSAACDFRLRGGSPCIDAGTNVNLSATDFFGRPRLVGPAVDIGSFEMPPAGIFFYGY